VLMKQLGDVGDAGSGELDPGHRADLLTLDDFADDLARLHEAAELPYGRAEAPAGIASGRCRGGSWDRGGGRLLAQNVAEGRLDLQFPDHSVDLEAISCHSPEVTQV